MAYCKGIGFKSREFFCSSCTGWNPSVLVPVHKKDVVALEAKEIRPTYSWDKN